jgi:hypothetical protein
VVGEVINMIPLELLFTAVLITLGLVAGKPVGLGVPNLGALLHGDSSIRWPLLVSTACGLALGVLSALLAFAFEPYLPPARMELPLPPAWIGILGFAGAAINEEIWFRLALMSGTAWVCSRVTTQTGWCVVIWVANVLAATTFAAFHLPSSAAIHPFTPPVITLGMLTRGLGGTVFGWLYWRHGLLAAMIGHLVGDVVLLLAFLV